MTHDGKRGWLRAGAALVLASGALVVLGAHPLTAFPARLLADLLFWPLDGLQTGLAGETRLLAAIGGGVLIGWGVMLWQLSGEMFDRAPEAVGRIIRTSVIAWFVVDSTGSFASGAWLNVVANLVFLALFLVPLWPRRKGAIA
jgi:hypothetical protein